MSECTFIRYATVNPRICEHQQKASSTLIRILLKTRNHRKLLPFCSLLVLWLRAKRLMGFRDVTSLLIPLKTTQEKKAQWGRVELLSEASSATN